MRTTRRGDWTGLFLLASAACGGAAQASPSDAGPALFPPAGDASLDAARDSPARGDAPRGFLVTGTLEDDPTSKPLASATLCLLDVPGVCSSSDASGAYSLSGVTDQRSGFTAALPGYVTGIWPLTPTGDLRSFGVFLRTPANANTLAASVGASFGATGAIHFETLDGAGKARAAVAVSAGPAGTVAYIVTPGKLSTAVPSTSELGNGFVFGLPEGDVTLTFAAAGSTCARTSANGWDPRIAGGTMTVPVKAGQITRASATCP